ncbi:hypothetical protein NKR23_g9590 [Pleurostoma richardsiae]|uniref:Uncharacterized protein n=1 Tax=Pleurostoma richardsiae TaxID=41990 RepID=A0AA38R4A9_9PEZI|nr:hypothetical protein NKR23_g9590 [Pleurostoma richardsiae]
MSSPPSSGASTPSPRGGRAQLPPELMEILYPSLQIGAGAGTLGLFVGAAAGIARSAPPVLFALASGAQWFALGSSYYASRSVVMRAWGGDEKLSKFDKVKASGIAGGFAGVIGGLLRGPRNVLPGAIVFSLFGVGGQALANGLSSEGVKQEKNTSWLDSKWSPVKRLTDEQYEKVLEEKILQLEVEIALVDDKIADIRASQQQSRPNDARPNSVGDGKRTK